MTSLAQRRSNFAFSFTGSCLILLSTLFFEFGNYFRDIAFHDLKPFNIVVKDTAVQISAP